MPMPLLSTDKRATGSVLASGYARVGEIPATADRAGTFATGTTWRCCHAECFGTASPIGYSQRSFFMFRALAFIPILVLSAACGGFECEEKCNEPKLRTELVRVLQSQGEDVDENTICHRKAIKDAENCAECKSAFLSEFGVEPVSQEGFCD
jgi:hypothetical protein